MSTVKFAEEIKQYIPYKEHIASEMQHYLCELDAALSREQEKEFPENTAAEKKEQQSAAWLDNYINNR